MSTDLPTQACWTAEDARMILRIEALEGGVAAFKATHFPVRGFDVSGAHGGEIVGRTEDDVLEVLASPERRHAFCVVEGEPGSGKSHLVRWLAVNWPDQADRLLLLRRADGSLQGALRQLQNWLGEEYSHLFQRIGLRQQASFEGRADLFLSSLSASLKPDHFEREKQLPDTEWCQRYDPTFLLSNRKVQEGWTAPKRILRLLDGAGGKRDSREAQFDVADIAELAEFDRFITETVRTIQLVRKLKHESEFVRGWIDMGLRTAEILKEHQEKIPFTLQLTDALNARFHYSVQHVLGISSEGLKGLFRELRQELKQRGKRLVLLLEDITSWQGIDDSLVDALVTNAEAGETEEQKSDLCDLISVVGVTPDYCKHLRANYQQRITHHIKLGEETGALQNVLALRTPDAPIAFVARYLAAARAGKNQLEEWRQALSANPQLLPPNACTDCRYREACHAAFGRHGEIGLFPFTPMAITRMFNSLKEADGNMTWKTPRGIIQAILAPTLDQPELIEAHRYPGPEIETSKFEERSGSLSGFALSKINATDASHQVREQLQRLIAFWGNKEVLETRAMPDGVVTFAGIPKPVFETFRLPWLGDTETSPRPATAT